jgi:hypothetical protein
VEGKEVGLCEPESNICSVWSSGLLWGNASDDICSYGNPTGLPAGVNAENYEEFAKHFIESFAPEILKAYLEQVDLWVSKRRWMSRICLSNIIAFLDEW